jgi:hypothetical protein
VSKGEIKMNAYELAVMRVDGIAMLDLHKAMTLAPHNMR